MEYNTPFLRCTRTSSRDMFCNYITPFFKRLQIRSSWLFNIFNKLRTSLLLLLLLLDDLLEFSLLLVLLFTDLGLRSCSGCSCSYYSCWTPETCFELLLLAEDAFVLYPLLLLERLLCANTGFRATVRGFFALVDVRFFTFLP